MRIISLQSGSNGNSIYVEAGDVRLLFDAGLSGIEAQFRLALHGHSIRRIDALLISHDHADHSRSMGVFSRKFGMPVYVTPATLAAASARFRIGPIGDLRHFAAGETLRLGGVTVETVPTPHDGADGVVFVVDDGRRRVGILTDLGHVFNDLPPVVESLDAVLLESNYDPEMLARGPYPEFLKRRIRGPGGHISNIEAAELLERHARRLRWACLGHLSHENNHPELAMETHRRVLGERWPLYLATRYAVSEVMETESTSSE